jgi:hypothetical protein
MMNTDFSQYKSFGECLKYAETMSKEIISDVKTDLSIQNLEDLQRKDAANVPMHDINTDAVDRLYNSDKPHTH